MELNTKCTGTPPGVTFGEYQTCSVSWASNEYGERFGKARYAFEQDVAVGEHPDEQPVDEVFLADDHLGCFGLHLRQSLNK